MTPAQSDDCKHLKGTWERQGRWAIILCEKGDSRTIIDIDSPEAYQLFEGISGAVQQFGNPLHTATPDDEERLEVWVEEGLTLP